MQPMSNYKTKLAKDIHLNVSEWEVGLAEFIYPNSWSNITEGTFKVRKLENHKWIFAAGKIPVKQYENAEDLVEYLKDAVSKVLGIEQRNEIHIKYIDNTRRLKVNIREGYALELSHQLSQSLGFGDNHKKCIIHNLHENEMGETCDRNVIKSNNDEKITSPFIVDVNRGLRSIFIHCNIVQPQLVGDLYVPLLRTVAVKGQTDDVVSEAFSNIHYMSIERSTFQEIEIHITDDLGRTIPFQHGRVIVKLHFRRI